MNRNEVLGQVKSILRKAFGDRLKGLVLYGSQARGQAGPDSDIDLLVLLKGPVNDHDDSWACIRALYPLVLELERPIHCWPTDVEEYEAGVLPLYSEAKREGMPG